MSDKTVSMTVRRDDTESDACVYRSVRAMSLRPVTAADAAEGSSLGFEIRLPDET